MAELSTSTARSGTQSSTQSPQAATTSLTGAASSSVQPGTVPSLLDTTKTGVPLTNTPVTTINFAKASASSQVAAAPKPASQVSPAMLGITIVFLVAAAAIFLAINRSAKNTTE